VWIHASLKDADDIQRQVKSLYIVRQMNSGALSVSAILQLKTLYFLPIACQCMLANCGANTHRLSAYVLCIHNAFRIVHYIPRNASVRSHQVSHRVTTLDAYWEIIYTAFCCASSSNLFIQFLQISDAFYKFSFFLNCLTLSVWQWPTDIVVDTFHQCTRLISIVYLHNNVNLLCASWRPRISLLTCSSMQTTRANQAYKK